VADTRDALIAAAIEVLRESGFASASARKISQRAGCNQALVFYHFGSVTDLQVAALEEVSAQRMAAYRGLLDHTGTLAELAAAARVVFEADLDAGHVRVLTEMISGAQSVPGLGERIAAVLAPWREFAVTAVRDVMAASPLGPVVPPEQAAHAVVAGILGLEMLASLDGDRDAALALFDHARDIGDLLDRMRPVAALLAPAAKAARLPARRQRAIAKAPKESKENKGPKAPKENKAPRENKED
jgi:AcrR family transcriptional regulator